MKVFERDEEQEAAIRTMVTTSAPGCVNGSQTGRGKTVMAVRVAHERGSKRTLIIAPPNTYDNWAPTVEAVAGQKLRFCGNSKLGDVTAAEAKANMADAQAGEDGWFFVGREMFLAQCRKKVLCFNRKKEPIVDPRTGEQKVRTDFDYKWGKVKPFGVAAYDEVQMISSTTAKSNQAFKYLQADFKMLQSADWFGSDLSNMYNIANLAFPGWLDMTKLEFIENYLTTEYDHFAWKNIKVTGEEWPGFFASSMPCYVALPPAVEKPEPERRYVDLSPAQRKLYDKLENDMVAEIEGDYLVIDLPMHLSMRLHELALGMFKPVYGTRINKETGEVESTTTIEFEEGAESSKLDEVKSIMRDYPGEHFIILTHSQKFAEKAAKDLGGLPYTGKQSISEKAENKRAFLAGETKILVGTDAMAEGLDGLQDACHHGIIVSRPLRSYATSQWIGRIARRGQKHGVQIHEIVARNTRDTGRLSAMIEKALANNRAKAIQKKEEK